MRAIIKARPGPGCELVDVPVPAPGPGEVLIRVAAAGICGTDLHIYGWDSWAQSRVRIPRVIGHEFCGVVAEVGDGVDAVRVGDRVAGECHVACGCCRPCLGGQPHICQRLEIIGIDRDGAFADYVVLPAGNAWRLDPAIPSDVAAIMDPLGNAVHTAMATEMDGRAVLVTGCGPIGLMAIPVCKMAGAALVIASDVADGRLELARRMGADHVIDARGGGVPERVRKMTGGDGADAVLEMSGHPSGIRDALQAVRGGGWVGLLGLPGAPVELDLVNLVVFKEARLQGIFGRLMWQTWEQMSSMLVRGLDIRPIITHRLPLERFGEAFHGLESGGAGKVILTIDS